MFKARADEKSDRFPICANTQYERFHWLAYRVEYCNVCYALAKSVKRCLVSANLVQRIWWLRLCFKQAS